MSGAFNVFIHFGQTSLEAWNGDALLELPLERVENGRLSDACRERLVTGLRAFFNPKGWRVRPRALVAIGARGVSIRRLALPIADTKETQRLLRLQIESEFPLSPDELAWGFQLLGQKAGHQEALVAAVKKDVIDAYTQLLGECGINPSFTLTALALLATRPPPLPGCIVLESGPAQSELLILQDGVPSSIRLLPLAARDPAMAQRLTNVQWSVLDSKPAAILAGLQKLNAPLLLQLNETKAGKTTVQGVPWKWVAATALLLLAAVFFPYLEAIALKPHLAKKLAALEVDRGRLPAIDRELEFLQYIKANQPPYLDVLYLLAKVAPQGTVFDSLNMTRRGELALRGKMGGAQQVTDLRAKLIEAGWFSSVVVEEQTPTPDRKVTVRMTAMLKPAESRKPLAVDSAPAKLERARK